MGSRTEDLMEDESGYISLKTQDDGVLMVVDISQYLSAKQTLEQQPSDLQAKDAIRSFHLCVGSEMSIASDWTQIRETLKIPADCYLSTLMHRHLSEIIKNSADVVVAHALKSSSPETEATLLFKADIQSPNVVLSIQDNGPGFPNTFLDEMEQGRHLSAEQFAAQELKTSSKSTTDSDSLGGRAFGVRNLIASAKYQSKIGGHVIEKEFESPKEGQTDIAFSNDNGAVITITAPIQPLVELTEQASEVKETENLPGTLAAPPTRKKKSIGTESAKTGFFGQASMGDLAALRRKKKDKKSAPQTEDKLLDPDKKPRM